MHRGPASTTPTAGRRGRWAAAAGAAATAALLLAGCGGGGGDATTAEQPDPDAPVTSGATATGTGPGGGSPSTGPPGTSTPPDAVPADLTVVVDDGEGGTSTWDLRCAPAGGTHPQPAAACRALSAGTDALAPVPAAVACTEIYGGPQTARLSGTLDGAPLTAGFRRTDGCEIDRWETLVPLLPAVQGAAAP